MNDIILACITTTLGLVGGAIISIKLSKNKNPLWYFRLNVLFSKGISKIEELKITYKDYFVDNLSSGYLAFWNNGKETITANDVAEKISFCVSEGYSIYHAEVVKATKASNEFKVAVSEDRRKVELTFRYIDYKQGVVVQLFSDCDNIKNYELQGAVMGCKNFTKKVYNRKGLKYVYMTLTSVCAAIFSSIISAIATFKIRDKIFSLVAYTVVLVVVLGLFVLLKYVKETRYKLPKELRSYFSE